MRKPYWVWYLAFMTWLAGIFFLMFSWGYVGEAKQQLRGVDACAKVAEGKEQWLRCTEEWR